MNNLNKRKDSINYNKKNNLYQKYIISVGILIFVITVVLIFISKDKMNSNDGNTNIQIYPTSGKLTIN